MFNLYDEPKINMPKLDTYKPIEMHPIQEQSYVTFAYNCRTDAYNQQEDAKDPDRDISWDIKHIIEHKVLQQGESPVNTLKI